MNKIFNKILLFVFAILILPVSCLLVGCGATAVNSAQGVTFLSNVQDENGQPVFALDLGSSLKLPYKITPSSAYGYSPRFTAISGISGDNMETYTLDIFTGEFCIKRADFKDVEVEITVGSYTDTCKITLKEYPTEIGIYDETKFNSLNKTPKISLASGSSYQINVAGIFEDSEIIDETTGEKRPSLLLDSEYNFYVEADEKSQTLINVPNHNRLSFVAYGNCGTAKVKVALCDYFGNIFTGENGIALFAFEIEMDIYMPCESMDIRIDGADSLISSENNGKEYTIKMSTVNIDIENAQYELNFEAYFYDKYDRLILDDRLEVNCFIDKTTYITIDNINKTIYVKTPPSGESFRINVEMWSNASLETGNFCTASFVLLIKF